jgi:hypothetical protein
LAKPNTEKDHVPQRGETRGPKTSRMFSSGLFFGILRKMQ